MVGGQCRTGAVRASGRLLRAPPRFADGLGEGRWRDRCGQCWVAVQSSAGYPAVRARVLVIFPTVGERVAGGALQRPDR